MMMWRFMFCWLIRTCALCLNSNSYTENHISLHFSEGLAVLCTFCGKLSRHYLNSTWEKASIHSFFLGAIIRCLYGCCKQSLHVYVCHAHSLQTPSPDSSIFFSSDFWMSPWTNIWNSMADPYRAVWWWWSKSILYIWIAGFFFSLWLLFSSFYGGDTPILGETSCISSLLQNFCVSRFLAIFRFLLLQPRKILQRWFVLSIFS